MFRSSAGIAVLMVTWAALSSPARANDRLPERLRAPYEKGMDEVRRYTLFILKKVWTQRLEALVAQGQRAPASLRSGAHSLTDEIAHLLLPYSQKLVVDSIFGTSGSHLHLTMPARGRGSDGKPVIGPAGVAAGAASGDTPVEAMRAAIANLGGAGERELNDRIEQALTEDLEDYVQRNVESYTGLPVAGRPRGNTRPLSEKFDRKYEEEARLRVHRYAYWWLRKRRRLELTELATTRSREALDRARDEGPVWGMTSGVSQEAWAQNRLDLDFKWGRIDWQIDRRRMRRRMDQDLAQGTWAMARMVKELTSPETIRKAEGLLQQRVEEELSKAPLRNAAERYPESASELEQATRKLEQELNPIFDGAMAKVTLPPDMARIAPTTREHGRRFAREELQGTRFEAIRRAAGPLAAARRAREKLPTWAGESLSRFDPGDPGRDGALGNGQRREALKKRARAHVRNDVTPLLKGEVEDALRAAGFENAKSRAPAVIEKLGLAEELDRTVEGLLPSEKSSPSDSASAIEKGSPR